MKHNKRFDWFDFVKFVFHKVSPSFDNIKYLTEEQLKERTEILEKLKSDFNSGKSKIDQEYVLFIEKAYDEESNRQSIIESKLSQLTGQSGVLFALISLFVPLFYNTLSEYSLWFKIPVIIVFVLGFLLFLISLLWSTKTLNVKNFVYSYPDIETVYKSNKNDFIKSIINSRFTGIKMNIETNNNKCKTLIYSHKAFVSGFICVGLLSILITCASLFKKEPAPVTIKDLSKIEEINSKVNKLEYGFLLFQKEKHEKDNLRQFEFFNRELIDVKSEIEQLKNQSSSN